MAIVLTYDQSSLKQFETRTQIDYSFIILTSFNNPLNFELSLFELIEITVCLKGKKCVKSKATSAK